MQYEQQGTDRVFSIHKPHFWINFPKNLPKACFHVLGSTLKKLLGSQTVKYVSERIYKKIHFHYFAYEMGTQSIGKNSKICILKMERDTWTFCSSTKVFLRFSDEENLQISVLITALSDLWLLNMLMFKLLNINSQVPTLLIHCAGTPQ